MTEEVKMIIIGLAAAIPASIAAILDHRNHKAIRRIEIKLQNGDKPHLVIEEE